ncbi:MULTISPECIES: hypothetical protein [Xanthomonas]|nr:MULTISPECIES: hypothetical protein [Xanthomonas]MBB4724461.1 hypothetical protein [Xanthomonas euvesicatoria]MBB4871321.1 hypothetical protein [Xanthomonas euvesicatoria]MBO9792961.1 hypothetical protein [Xanthomonas phaseoli pv. dieffenbachiae]MBO9850322.1 hypothetical protein [Xanthomonas phaseoli pv. dieffenbachiae]
MKRRKFIQSSLAAGAVASSSGGVVAADQAMRVFGQPASLTGGTANSAATKMLLPLSRGGMPTEGWDRWSKLTAAVVEMFSDPSQRRAFNNNPHKFLANLGYDSAMEAPTLALLVALSDPLVQSAALEKDYISLLNYLHVAGALEKPKSDVLTQQMSKVLSSNLAIIKETLGLAPDAPLDAETVKRFVGASASVPTAADLAAIGNIAQLVRVAPGQAVAGAIAAVVAAVEAAVGVQVVAVLFNYVTFVTHTSVTGATPSPGQPQTSQSMSTGIFTGQMSRLDPDICDSCTVAQRAAAMLGAPELYSEHAKLVIHNEVASFLRAMQQVGLIGFEESSFETIVDAVYQYGMRTITA